MDIWRAYVRLSRAGTGRVITQVPGAGPGKNDMLELKQREEEGVTVLDLIGPIDMDSEKTLDGVSGGAASNGAGCFIWNLQDVSSITSSGIAILFNAYADLKKRGRDTKLVNVSPEILDILEVHKILPAFDILTDETVACKKIRMEHTETERKFKRLYERADVDLKARFRKFRQGREAEELPVHEAEARSLSHCGIFLSTEVDFPKDTVLEVTIMPDEGLVEHRVSFLAKVVWVADRVKQANLYPGLALSIVTMEKGERAKLDDILHHYGL